jgi:hypothetical protein
MGYIYILYIMGFYNHQQEGFNLIATQNNQWVPCRLSLWFTILGMGVQEVYPSAPCIACTQTTYVWVNVWVHVSG